MSYYNQHNFVLMLIDSDLCHDVLDILNSMDFPDSPSTVVVLMSSMDHLSILKKDKFTINNQY